MADDTLQHTLNHILDELRSRDPSRCLQAMRELEASKASSPAILREVEQLALSGPNDEVRVAARVLLKNPANRLVRQRFSKMSRADRGFVLGEIEKWQADGLLEPERAEILRQRYNFDEAPPPARPVSAPVAPIPERGTSQPAVPPAPRPSLMQTLLSESSIKIYLYLGAFFVIASALILAALVEAARLPILLAASLAFGSGALALHKRLPQPSFALFIVFSFLLPIDANVFEEMLSLREPTLSVYWTIVFLLMAVIWGFSVWFYTSRFFSAVAFVALSLAFYRAGQIFQTEFELQILFGMVACFAGLAATSLFKQWKDRRFAGPVFVLAQIQVVGLLLASLIVGILHLFGSDIARGWWLVTSLVWMGAAIFFAASDLLFPFFLFPWLSVAALLPLPWFFLNTFHGSPAAYGIGFWIWGAVVALASEAAFRLEKIKRYGWALLAGSAALFGTALLIAFDWDRPALTFSLLAGTAVVYAGLHVLRPRDYVWSAALLSALLAYLVFFSLPMIERMDVPVTYRFLVASLLLTVPELFQRPPLTIQNQTRPALLIFGVLVSVLCMSSALADVDHPGRAAIVFITIALLLTLHGFHANRPWLGYFATAAESTALVYALQYFDLDLWLPALTLLAVLYYATGFWLRRTGAEFRGWALVLIHSGLILGVLVSLNGVAVEQEHAGWYTILIALLFTVETFARPLAWLEVVVEILLSLALFRILADYRPTDVLYHTLFGISLIWMAGDLVFSRLIEKRLHRPLTLGVGYLFVAATAFIFFIASNNFVPVVYYFIYAAFFAAYALTQKEPRLGYGVTAFIPVAVFKLYEALLLEKWIFPLIVLAVLYYVLGFWFQRNQKAKGWEYVLINSGLALGVITSVGAAFEGGLASSIPIAIAATLFAVEALRLRNVWWALPAHALYLLSYFVLLAGLHVEEPQYYSIGAALLGMLMHYLLTRAGSRTGACVMGMLSQLVLLGTTYIQMVSANDLTFFFVLFAQSLIVLVYGLMQRSRSLVITPIAFAVLGVVTVVYSALKGLSSVILVGCTGMVLLLLGIAAVLLRERITKFGEQLSDWKP